MHTSPTQEFYKELPPYMHNMPFSTTIKGLLERMDFAGVDLSVIWIVARGKPTLKDIQKVNNFVAGIVSKYPDKFVGFANIYPPHGEKVMVEIERAVNELGLRGIKMHPRVQQFKMSHPSVIKVLEIAKEYDLPVVIHVSSGCGITIPDTLQIPPHLGMLMQDIADSNCEFSKSRFLADIMQYYNSRKLQAAHMGGIYNSEITRSNITFQTTGCSVAAIEYAYAAVGPERIVYGSDFGGGIPDIAPEIAKVRRARIPNDAKEKILGKNAIQILNL